MSDSRLMQVAINNIVWVTRFKILAGKKLMWTLCWRLGCEAADSWGHFCLSYEVPEIGTFDRKAKTQAIIPICRGAMENRQARPRPSEIEYGDVGGGKNADGNRQENYIEMLDTWDNVL